MGFKIHFCRLATVAKPNRCSSDRFPTPFVFFPRWKYEKINTGLSHHLLVHCSKVRQPAGDFDYFLLPCQTQPSIRSYHNFFPIFFYPPSFPPPHPCCSCCSSLIWWFSAHQVWPVVISSLSPSILPPLPTPPLPRGWPNQDTRW